MGGLGMSHSLVIGLYPIAPSDGATLEKYFHSLTITAYQVDFGDHTTLLAPARTKIGAATYTTSSDPKNSILQLESKVGPATEKSAAADAVIELPPTIEKRLLTPESLVNVLLDMKRGAAHIVNYDVEVYPTAAPTSPITSLSGVVVGLYLALADPNLDPSGPITFLVSPADGSRPPYGALDMAIKAIVAEDPEGAPDTTEPSPADCLHIARELVSNRGARPLPLLRTGGQSHLAQLYTSPGGSGSDNDRRQSESALVGYYSQLTGDATRMAGFIYRWSAAQKCQQLTKDALLPRVRTDRVTSKRWHPAPRLARRRRPRSCGSVSAGCSPASQNRETSPPPQAGRGSARWSSARPTGRRRLGRPAPRRQLFSRGRGVPRRQSAPVPGGDRETVSVRDPSPGDLLDSIRVRLRASQETGDA
jgi:hypothetical protein